MIFDRRLTNVEAREDAVVETTLHTAGLDASRGKEVDYLACELRAALAWVGSFIVMLWEAIETELEVSTCITFRDGSTSIQYLLVYKVCVYGVVQLDRVSSRLPVGGENHYCCGFHLLGDLSADLLEFRIDRVLGVILDVGLGVWYK